MLCSPTKLLSSIRLQSRLTVSAFISLVLPGFLLGQVLDMESPVRHLVNDYCISCHNPDKKKGKLDLESILDVDMQDHFEIWDEVSWMLREREMPPEDKPDEPRPVEADYDTSAELLEKILGLGDQAFPAISSKLAVVVK